MGGGEQQAEGKKAVAKLLHNFITGFLTLPTQTVVGKQTSAFWLPGQLLNGNMTTRKMTQSYSSSCRALSRFLESFSPLCLFFKQHVSCRACIACSLWCSGSALCHRSWSEPYSLVSFAWCRTAKAYWLSCPSPSSLLSLSLKWHFLGINSESFQVV